MIRALAIAARVAGASTPARAADTIDGVWRGTLGTQPIVACFFGDYGNYYYEKHRHGIELSLDADAQRYAEGLSQGEATGYWQVAVEAGELRGEWKPPKPAGRSQPIRARRVALPDPTVSSCSSEAFNSPRLETLPLASKPVVQAGLAVTLDQAEGTDVSRVRLREPGPANAAMARALDAQFHDALASAWDCRVEGGQGEYLSTQAVEFADARWLVVRADGGGYCGGAHPDSWSTFFVFERASGRRVDTSGWLKPENEGLWRLLVAKAKPEGECLEAWQSGAGFPEVRPSKLGLRFDPAFPHVMQACSESVELSMDEARPYLAAEALRALQH
jgi:hypothetical protein